MAEPIKTVHTSKLTANAYRIEFEEKANLDNLMAVLKEVLGRAGCPACGRLSILDIRLDPRVIFERELPGIRSITELPEMP